MPWLHLRCIPPGHWQILLREAIVPWVAWSGDHDEHSLVSVPNSILEPSGPIVPISSSTEWDSAYELDMWQNIVYWITYMFLPTLHFFLYAFSHLCWTSNTDRTKLPHPRRSALQTDSVSGKYDHINSFNQWSKQIFLSKRSNCCSALKISKSFV